MTHPNLEPPMCFRGFHPQEMIEVALLQGKAATFIEKVPCALPKDKDLTAYTHQDLKMFHPCGEHSTKRFDRHIKNSSGWIDCRTKSGLGHAVAYQGRKRDAVIYDPNGDTFVYKGLDSATNHGLTFVSLYRLDEIA